MKQEAATQFPFAWLTVVGLFLFLSTFISIAIVVYQKKRKNYFEEASKLPLSE